MATKKKVLTTIPHTASQNAVAIAEALVDLGGGDVAAVAAHLKQDAVGRWVKALTADERAWLSGLGLKI